MTRPAAGLDPLLTLNRENGVVTTAEEVPAPAQMVQLLAGFQISQALYVVAKLGLSTALAGGPRTIDQLAAATGAQADVLRRIIRTLAAIGVFRTDGERVEATPLGLTMAEGYPGSVRDIALFWMETHYAPFGDLLHTIRTGQPAAEHYYGKPFFSWLSDHPEQAGRYTAAMANLTGGFKTAAIASLPLDGIKMIVDVGGADGTVLAAILTAHPQLRGVLFDLPPRHRRRAQDTGPPRRRGPGRMRRRRLPRIGTARRGRLPSLPRPARLAR